MDTGDGVVHSIRIGKALHSLNLPVLPQSSLWRGLANPEAKP
jgi:hypothetical protein